MPDVELKIIIPSAKVAAVKAGFLHEEPKPPTFTGTDAEWLEECWRQRVTKVTRKGLRKLAAKNEPLEESYTD